MHCKATFVFRLFTSCCLLVLITSCGKDKIEATFSEVASGVEVPLNDITFLDNGSGYAVGGDRWLNGVVLRTDDGGGSWTNHAQTNKELFGVHFWNTTEGILVGIDGEQYFTTDAGSNFSFFRSAYWNHANASAFLDADHGLIVGGVAFGKGHIQLYSGGSVSIDTSFEHELSDVVFVDNQIAIAVGYGLVARSTDGGYSWLPLDVQGDFYRAVNFPSNRVGYVVGFSGSILKSTDAGAKWEKLRNGNNLFVSNEKFRDVQFKNEDEGYVCGHDGLLWKTINGGKDWSEFKNAPDVDFNSIALTDMGGVLVGEGGKIVFFAE